jgi:hypothetical protein
MTKDPMRKRLHKMTPRQAVKKWERDLATLKKKTEKECEENGWTGRQKSVIFSKRSSKLAKTIAKLAGMKSMGEVKCAADMDERGIKYTYEGETFAYQHAPQKYTPDFNLKLIKRKGRKPLHVEYKGKMTNDIRKKMLAVQRCNPNIKIAIVFENSKNGITKRRKKKDGTYNTPTKYWQWAEQKGFLWSEHTVKEEWL